VLLGLLAALAVPYFLYTRQASKRAKAELAQVAARQRRQDGDEAEWYRQREANRRKEEEKRIREEQQRTRIRILAVLLNNRNRALIAFEGIPKKLSDAEEMIDVAEQDFQDGAFAPFWDTIEQATTKLAEVNDSVQEVEQHSRWYANSVTQYEINLPAFPISRESVHRLLAANSTGQRLKSIVRQAQRDFNFATIYEQRKTNKILIAGFSNLGEALRDLGERLHESISNLEGSVLSMSNKLEDALYDVSSSVRISNDLLVYLSEAVSSLEFSVNDSAQFIGSTLERNIARVEERFKEEADRQRQALHMLDNIQRRRYPSGRNFGDRAY
jgi:type II secretory pathway pseudopilin PulG